MKAMFAGFAAAIVIGLGAGYALDQVDLSSQEVYSGPNVRLD